MFWTLIPAGIALAVPAAASAAASKEAGSCAYALVRSSETLEWKAFKETGKVGVPGKFKEFSVSTGKVPAAAGKNPSLDVLLRGVEFKVDVSTVDTGVPLRDETLFKNFFLFVNGGKILTGRISKVKASGPDSGKATIDMKVNGKTRKSELAYRMTGADTIEFTGELNLPKTGMAEALVSLSQACHDLHKGPDGVSKTWPTVEVKVTAKVKKNCG